MPWEPPALETDPDAATDRILEAMGDKMPGWEPYEGAVEVVLAEEIGRESADLSALMADMLQVAVAGWGETIYGLTSFPGAVATLDALVTVSAVGDGIPAGLTVLGTTATGVEVAFVLDELVVATGNPQPVTFSAIDIGTESNGVAGDLLVVTSTATVISAETVTPSAGGVDVESLDAYVDRLIDWLGTLRPGGVRADDLAALARSVPGVWRALGLDLHNPADPGVPTERTATVVPIDDTGQPVGTVVADQVRDVLEAAREVNFIIHLAEPTYTGVDVVATATALPGADLSAAEDAITVALASYLSPARWGNGGTVGGDDQMWTNEPTVRYLDLVRVASAVPSIARLDTLTLNGGTVDVTLPGYAPLPAATTHPTDPTTIGVTVV